MRWSNLPQELRSDSKDQQVLARQHCSNMSVTCLVLVSPTLKNSVSRKKRTKSLKKKQNNSGRPDFPCFLFPARKIRPLRRLLASRSVWEKQLIGNEVLHTLPQCMVACCILMNLIARAQTSYLQSMR